MTWRNEHDEIIIRCNNNKHSYYEDFVGGTVIIRKDVYDKYVKDHFVKFFAYSENGLLVQGMQMKQRSILK